MENFKKYNYCKILINSAFCVSSPLFVKTIFYILLFYFINITIIKLNLLNKKIFQKFKKDLFYLKIKIKFGLK